MRLVVGLALILASACSLSPDGSDYGYVADGDSFNKQENVPVSAQQALAGVYTMRAPRFPGEPLQMFALLPERMTAVEGHGYSNFEVLSLNVDGLSFRLEDLWSSIEVLTTDPLAVGVTYPTKGTIFGDWVGTDALLVDRTLDDRVTEIGRVLLNDISYVSYEMADYLSHTNGQMDMDFLLDPTLSLAGSNLVSPLATGLRHINYNEAIRNSMSAQKFRGIRLHAVPVGGVTRSPDNMLVISGRTTTPEIDAFFAAPSTPAPPPAPRVAQKPQPTPRTAPGQPGQADRPRTSPARKSDGGCSTGGNSASWLGLVMLSMMLATRRRYRLG